MVHRTFGRARLGVAITLAVAGIALGQPCVAHAQSLRQVLNIDLTGGIVRPMASHTSDLTTGGHVGIGISHELSALPLSLGVEGSIEWFGQRDRMAYGFAFPGGLDPTQNPPVGLTLANILLTAKYPFGHHAVRPYVALAAGMTQTRPESDYGIGYPYETKETTRATAGIETRLGRGDLGIEAGYVSVAAFRYAGSSMRYVPIMLRLSF